MSARAPKQNYVKLLIAANRRKNLERMNKPENKLVANLWDAFAQKRFSAIDLGQNRSHTEQLLPHWGRILREERPATTIDMGCGVGFVSKLAASYSNKVTGVDPSKRSIDIATEENSAENIDYVCSDAESFVSEEQAELVICNMVLMDCPDLSKFITECAQLIMPSGRIAVTIANPNYWPRYWGVIPPFVGMFETRTRRPFGTGSVSWRV
jgi:2-polyprenyl-3-methyl-5-hydroxy-6-metoxy-1,4-benzoquinol methylase